MGVLDDNKKPIAVQIPIHEFHRLEETIDNYGLSKLMDEVNNDEQYSIKEAKENTAIDIPSTRVNRKSKSE